MLHRCLDYLVIDLVGCPLPRSEARPEEHAKERAVFSRFDLLAGCGAGFLLNLCITVVVPVALSSAEARDHPSPLASSGSVAATTSVGMMLSLAAVYRWPASRLDSKAPFLLFGVTLLAGNVMFLLAECVRGPLEALLLSRVTMSLGFAASFVAKRRAATATTPRAREALFMRLELFNSLGMASGPLLSGALAIAMPTGSNIWPPLLMSALAVAFLALVNATPLEGPEDYAAQSEDSPATTGAELGGASAPCSGAKLPTAGERSPLVPFGVAALNEGSSSVQPLPMATAAAVQGTSLLFGITRNFLKFGFESAMVVVYDRQFAFSEGAAGVLAGACALSTLLSLCLYRTVCVRRCSSAGVLLLAEGCGLATAALMIATDLQRGRGASATDLSAVEADFPALEWGGGLGGGTGGGGALPLGLTIGASLLFYPAMYLGAAIGNSHPLEYAVAGHPLLSRSSMLVQQELLQTTIGKGLGMIFGRVSLGDPPRVAALGVLFAVVMLVQAVLLALGWNPDATRRAFARVRGGRRGAVRD